MTNVSEIQVLRINDSHVLPLKEFDTKVVTDQYRLLPKPKPGLLDWMILQGYVKLAPIPKPDPKKKPSKSEV